MPDKTNTVIPYVVKVATLTKALRNLYGLSQSDLAHSSGLSRPTISRLEKLSGDMNTKSDILEQLLNVFRELGVEIDINDDDVVLRIPNESLAKALKRAVEDDA